MGKMKGSSLHHFFDGLVWETRLDRLGQPVKGVIFYWQPSGCFFDGCFYGAV